MATHSIAGLEVEEHVFGSPPDAAVPLVIALHGRGGVPALPFGASKRACRVLVPRGPIALGEGFAWSSHYARERADAALARDLASVADRLAEVLAILRGDATRVIAIGFSQGAMAALALATRHPGLVDEVVVGAAWLPAALEPETALGLRIRMAHGEADDVVPFAWGRALADRLRARGFDLELRSFAGVGHASSSEMDAQLAAWRDEAIARGA